MTLTVDLSPRFPSEKVCENRFPNLLELGVLFSNLGLEDECLGDFRGRDGAARRS
ncbi:hypothetical protein J4T87_0038420 (plasmid) [Rhizobium sp. T1473]|uniref:hypothetical protein n=1 Tax=Rhizobium sp. T1473 TaxID=555321 RepID=UPI001AC31EC5